MASTLIRPLVLIALLAAICPSWLSAQSSTAANPWSFFNEPTGYPSAILPPACHALAYFSGSPLRFDLHGSLTFERSYRRGNQPPLAMSYRDTRALLGTVAGRKIYQINQSVTLGSPGASPLRARRIVVERTPGQYCLIFQTRQGTLRMLNPVKLTARKGHTFLVADDPVSGNGGLSDIHAWVFDRGRPYYLDFGAVIGQTLRRTLPSLFEYPVEAVLRPQELSYTADVSKPSDRLHAPTGGYVSIQFAVHGHTLTVASAKFTPPSLPPEPRNSKSAHRPAPASPEIARAPPTPAPSTLDPAARKRTTEIENLYRLEPSPKSKRLHAETRLRSADQSRIDGISVPEAMRPSTSPTV
ncbi:MAG: hypothetical protein ACRD04_09055 [Terriglobales bacterium]